MRRDLAFAFRIFYSCVRSRIVGFRVIAVNSVVLQGGLQLATTGKLKGISPRVDNLVPADGDASIRVSATGFTPDQERTLIGAASGERIPADHYVSYTLRIPGSGLTRKIHIGIAVRVVDVISGNLEVGAARDLDTAAPAIVEDGVVLDRDVLVDGSAVYIAIVRDAIVTGVKDTISADCNVIGSVYLSDGVARVFSTVLLRICP